MKQLGIAHSGIKGCIGDVKVVQWDRSDPFPALGSSVGIDTETELITDTDLTPPVVVLGCFDADHMTCYIVYWEDVPKFMQELCRRNVQQRYFNLGFDEPVIDNEDESESLFTAIDQGRVRDMQVRVHLNCIATIGFIPRRLYSLEGCSKYILKWKLDKGDGSETSARLSFRRANPDGSKYVITDEQAVYLAFDCISTWALGYVIPEAPTDIHTGQSIEVVHTQGMVCLGHISANGFLVDQNVYKALYDKLQTDKDRYRESLLTFGFPDPYSNPEKEKADINQMIFSAMYDNVNKSWEQQLSLNDYTSGDKIFYRRWLIAVVEKIRELAERGIINGTEVVPQVFDHVCREILFADELKLGAAMKRSLDIIVETYGLDFVDDAKKKIVYPALIAGMYDYLNAVHACSDRVVLEDMFQYASGYIEEHPWWLDPSAKVGPKKFFQDHVANLLQNNPKLHLELTEKSGEYKLTLKDMWRLSDLGITDKFLDAYTGFKHCVKLTSTYLDPKYIKSDSRVHPKFRSILRTGRVSCNSPNIQNLPSRDEVYPIKNMYRPPDGAILCATDFSFIELVSFANSCIERFGFSVMGDVINAGVDPHRWFAGVRDGLITSDTGFINDPKAIEELNAYLKKNVTKERRKDSKAANFGFPGGMSAKKFLVNCREQGIMMDLETATELREKWVKTFREMRYHMSPEEVKLTDKIRAMYAEEQEAEEAEDSEDDEENEEEEPQGGSDRKKFRAVLTNGMIRNNCSYCSALNVQFQGITAYGIKMAMWNLAMAGYLPRFCNMIHDEVVYWLYPEELKVHIPIIEKCMIDGMRVATPHVKVGVETTCMMHWDKSEEGTVEYPKLEWDGDVPLINESLFVQSVYNSLNK